MNEDQKFGHILKRAFIGDALARINERIEAHRVRTIAQQAAEFLSAVPEGATDAHRKLIEQAFRYGFSSALATVERLAQKPEDEAQAGMAALHTEMADYLAKLAEPVGKPETGAAP